MTKKTTAAAKRPARKAQTTKETVKRVQHSTAVKNGGQQAEWTERLQSTADKRAAARTDKG